MNLRAYVAARKRARNSSVRAEGHWHVQLAILLRMSYAEKQRDVFLLAETDYAFIYVDLIHARNIVDDP